MPNLNAVSRVQNHIRIHVIWVWWTEGVHAWLSSPEQSMAGSGAHANMRSLLHSDTETIYDPVETLVAHMHP